MRCIVLLCTLSCFAINTGGARANWEPATGFDGTAKQIIGFVTVGARLCALGDVVQYSDDGGRSWTVAARVPPLVSGIASFREKLHVVTEGGEVHAANAIEGSWKRVHRGANLGSTAGIVATKDTLWVHGKAGLFRSADGKSFKPVPLGPTFKDWAVGGLAELSGGKLVALASAPGSYSGGIIIISDDGGKTWTRPLPGASGTKLHVQGNALIVAKPDRVQRSTDGGATWEELWTAPSDAVHYNTFLDPGAGMFAFAATGSGIVTLDGGATWHEPFLPLELRDPVLGVVREGDSVWAIAVPFSTSKEQSMQILRRKIDLQITSYIDAGRDERCAIAFNDLVKLMKAAGIAVDPDQVQARKDECQRFYAPELVACLGRAKTMKAYDACFVAR